uniref:Malate dehydrogenase n=1 Tax=Ditylenchus dipsaci TaxID=166011 RepID=A0A915CTR1_9BILA
MSTPQTVEQWVVPQQEMHQFVVDCMAKVGVEQDQAAQLAELLIEADLRGHYSHGLNRLHVYLEDVLGGVSKNGSPKIVKQKSGTALVDGDNSLGVVVGNFCTDLAIELAKEHGIGWVVANHSNHYGICAHYGNRMANHGLVGMTFTNTSPCLFPANSSQMGLGSNPICVTANASTQLPNINQKDSFCLDMATSTVAFGKIEWGADPHGKPTTNPKEILEGGGLLPLGSGGEQSAAYKGTGLGMMVELFCGILAGSSFGKNVRQWREVNVNANLGQCFVALDPECFAPGFADRLQTFMDETRGLTPADANKPVLVAGDPERKQISECKKAGGIVYNAAIIEQLTKVGSTYKVQNMFSCVKLEEQKK